MPISSPARIGIGAIVAGLSMLVAGNYWLANPDYWYDSSYHNLQVVSLAFVVVGLVLVIRSGAAFIAQKDSVNRWPQFVPHRWSPVTKLGRQQPHHRAFREVLSVRFSANLPTVGLLYALTWSLVFAIILVLSSDNRHSVGLTVHLLSARQDLRLVYSKPPLLRINSHNVWYLDSKRIAPADLPRLLDIERGRRPEVVVFLDADPDLAYGDVLKAIDAIRGAHDQVILLGEKYPLHKE